MVKDASLLRKHYATTKFIYLDALSILPTDIAYIYFGNQCYETVPCPVMVRLNRVLRIDRMFEFFEKTETRTNFPNAFRITKVVLIILVLIHWNACFFFALRYAAWKILNLAWPLRRPLTKYKSFETFRGR